MYTNLFRHYLMIKYKNINDHTQNVTFSTYVSKLLMMTSFAKGLDLHYGNQNLNGVMLFCNNWFTKSYALEKI